jgi:hypothetical protein
MARKYSQNDQLIQQLIDAESTIHSLMAQVCVSCETETYNKCIDVLRPFFDRKNIAPYLHDYMSLSKDQFNDLNGKSLQNQIIAFGKELDKERDDIINRLVKFNFQ